MLQKTKTVILPVSVILSPSIQFQEIINPDITVEHKEVKDETLTVTNTTPSADRMETTCLDISWQLTYICHKSCVRGTPGCYMHPVADYGYLLLDTAGRKKASGTLNGCRSRPPLPFMCNWDWNQFREEMETRLPVLSWGRTIMLNSSLLTTYQPFLTWIVYINFWKRHHYRHQHQKWKAGSYWLFVSVEKEELLFNLWCTCTGVTCY